MNERIKFLRESLELSRAAFGEKLGISGDVVNNMERGRAEIREDRIKLICFVFDVNETWLRTGEGDPKKETDIEFGQMCADIGINDPRAREAIEKYYELSPEDKELWWKFMERFIKT